MVPDDRRSEPEAPGPDPTVTPGLDSGGGVPPGETPPPEGGLSGVSHQEKGPTRGWYAVTIVFVLVVAVAIAGFIAGHAFGLL